MDAFDRRQNLNIEYLKNVFFKYLKSENKQVKFEYCDLLVFFVYELMLLFSSRRWCLFWASY
jgi:hypothetical protein